MDTTSIKQSISGMMCGYFDYDDRKYNTDQLLCTIESVLDSLEDKLINNDKFVASLKSKLSELDIDDDNNAITHHAKYLDNPIVVANEYWVHTQYTFASSTFVSRVIGMVWLADNSMSHCLWQLKLTHADPVCEVVSMFIMYTLHHIIYNRECDINMITRYYDHILKKNIVDDQIVKLLDYHIKLGLSSECKTIFTDETLSDDHAIKSLSYAVYIINAIHILASKNNVPSYTKLLDHLKTIGICVDNRALIGAYVGASMGAAKKLVDLPKKYEELEVRIFEAI